MRVAVLAVVILCLAGVALAAPQLATDEPPLSAAFGDGDDGDPTYGPIEGSYFRATSYDRYTGTGWERTASPAQSSALEPPSGSAQTVRVRYEVRNPVRTLPAPWRPTTYEGPEAAAYAGSLEPQTTLEAGDTFTVTSRRPTWTETGLRNAGTAYPEGLKSRYTQLPAETPATLETRASEVTDDAETPYAKAVAVNRWLRTEKNYSLTVERPDDAVAATFAEEMDAGYCQYFATTMVAMLRSEGVPARYVTGYTPYEQVGAGEHVVRGKYAHTWVEVYFPGVGWVPFDPTPPAEREATRGVATADAGEDAAFERVRPAVTLQERTDGWRQLAADVEIDGELVPGSEVTVRVTDPEDGTPIDGAQLRFDGRPVGETDADGEVVAELPYVDRLRVTAYVYDGDGEPPPVEVPSDGDGEGSATSDSIRDLRYAAPETEISGSLAGLSETVLFRATVEEGAILRRGGPDAATDAATDDAPGPDSAAFSRPVGSSLRPSVRSGSVERVRLQSTGEERTFDLSTDIEVFASPVDGNRPGEPLSVAATIEGVPVANATVTAGKREVRTDKAGRATIPMPYERPATVVVERGAARGSASVSVEGTLGVAIDTGWSAGESLSVTAAVGDRPVPNATVTNGVESATTDADGTASIPAPYRSPGTVSVSRGDFSRTIESPVSFGNATVTVDDPAPGTRVLVRGSVDERPIRNAVVTLDGDPVTDTDRFGRARVRLPYRETVTLTVGRGDVEAERTVDVPTDVTIRTDGRATPGGSVDIRATVGGRPVENGTVLVGGEAVTRTDASGRATVDVPVFAATLDVGVERGAATGQTRVGHVWPYWAALVGLLAVALAVARRRGHLERFLRDPTVVFAALAAFLGGVLADFEGTLQTRDAGVAAANSSATDAAAETSAFLVEPATDNDVYRAWASLAAGLDGTQRTPAAVAERAIEAGLPEADVEELTKLFREVRYGGAEPTDEREARAEAALSRIREATR